VLPRPTSPSRSTRTWRTSSSAGPALRERRPSVGAHYDKVSDGCGAGDNWFGVVAVAYIYRTLKDIPLKKTLVFVAFEKEEKGLVGSRAMAEAIDKEQVARRSLSRAGA
jgi:hypothetical protein